MVIAVNTVFSCAANFLKSRKCIFCGSFKIIKTFYITIDKEGQEYLPHMYGTVNYVVPDEVRNLPLKVADIYQRLTT